MCGKASLASLMMEKDIAWQLWMTTLDSPGFTHWLANVNVFKKNLNSIIWFVPNLTNTSGALGVIMKGNSSPYLCSTSWTQIASFIILHALTYLNKIGWLRGNIGTYWMWLDLFKCRLMSLSTSGVIAFYIPFTSSIGCLQKPQSIYLLMSSYIPRPLIMTISRSLGDSPMLPP